MTRTHDLEALLLDVLADFEPLAALTRPTHITWCEPHELIDDESYWAAAYSNRLGNFIGLRSDLKTAPRYVVRYLITHEVLHFALPRRGKGGHHHKAFRVAERLSRDYVRANDWLFRKHNRPKARVA